MTGTRSSQPDIEVLRWIADGCPHPETPHETHNLSVRAAGSQCLAVPSAPEAWLAATNAMASGALTDGVMPAMPIPSDYAPATFSEAWHTWLKCRQYGMRPLRLSTIADYESCWRCHLEPVLGQVALAEIDGVAMMQLVVTLSARGVRPARIYKVVAPVRACLRWHYRINVFDRDPTRWFDYPIPPTAERRILTIAQIERLIAAMPVHHRPTVTFAAYTGVRLGELRAITWDDVDFERRIVRINKTYYLTRLQRSTKSGYDRVVPIPSHVLGLLIEWRSRCPDPSPAGLVFPGKEGGILNADTFRATVWRNAVRRAGLPSDLRIHDLRHTSASLYLQHGATVYEVMEIHGWRQLKTAMRYLHTTGSLNAAADRLSAARDAVYEQWSLDEGGTAAPVELGGDPPRAGGVLVTGAGRT